MLHCNMTFRSIFSITHVVCPSLMNLKQSSLETWSPTYGSETLFEFFLSNPMHRA